MEINGERGMDILPVLQDVFCGIKSKNEPFRLLLKTPSPIADS